MRARSARRPIRANSTTCCSRHWPGWARRFRSSLPTSAFSAAPGSARSRSRSGARRSAARQCRSSAIRFFRNGSARWRGCCRAYADVAWQNAATNFLERTLDDSANRRTILPEALVVRRRDRNARSHGDRGTASRRTAHRRERAHVRALRGNGSGDDGGRSSRRQTVSDCTKHLAVRRWRRGRRSGEGEDNPLSALLSEERELTALRRSCRDSAAARSQRARGHGAAARAPARRPHREPGTVPAPNRGTSIT